MLPGIILHRLSDELHVLALDDNRTEMIFIVEGAGSGVNILGRIFAIVYNRNLDVAIPNLIQEYEQIASTG